ncbi:MAG: NADH:flavin oxidoreductase [Actinomycetota bacterium]
MRITQVKSLRDAEAFEAHVESLGVDLPWHDDPASVLSRRVVVRDGTAGELSASNRLAILPMEGWDGTADGRPTDLVQRRWARFGASGAGLVWGEATALVPEGRANPNQLVLSDETVEDIAALRALLADDQVAGLQLTHSGRYARPADRAPRTAYVHPALDEPSGATEASVLSDDELDELVVAFVDAAVLARDAGFDFVDVKACHGYLGHELLSAYDRTGRYGGDFAGRTRFMRSVIEGIRSRAPDLAIGARISIFDMAPFRPGAGGVGETTADGEYRYAFGGDGTGVGIDLAEPSALLSMLEDLGVGLVSATAGSPYYVPHVQRPAYFPPSDGYRPPEDPLVGVARLLAATAELARRHPAIVVVGSGYSYLQQWLAPVAAGAVAEGGASMIGLGRMALSYPDMPNDVLAEGALQTRLICRTFSDCTTAPRAGLVSGCFPLDPFYKEHEHRVALAAAKKASRSRLG